MNFAAFVAHGQTRPHAGLLPDYVANGLTVVSGSPKSYKTFLAWQAAFAVATGTPFLDGTLPTRAGRVVYISDEDPDLTERLAVMASARHVGLRVRHSADRRYRLA